MYTYIYIYTHIYICIYIIYKHKYMHKYIYIHIFVICRPLRCARGHASPRLRRSHRSRAQLDLLSLLLPRQHVGLRRRLAHVLGVR